LVRNDLIFLSPDGGVFAVQAKIPSPGIHQGVIMREGIPSPKFGSRGLHYIHIGGGSFLAKLYGSNDELIATLTEKTGKCLIHGHVGCIQGANCRPTEYERHLVEMLADGTVNVVHRHLTRLAANNQAWNVFLDAWINQHQVAYPHAA
jgi:hypothetical protein